MNSASVTSRAGPFSIAKILFCLLSWAHPDLQMLWRSMRPGAELPELAALPVNLRPSHLGCDSMPSRWICALLTWAVTRCPLGESAPFSPGLWLAAHLVNLRPSLPGCGVPCDGLPFVLEPRFCLGFHSSPASWDWELDCSLQCWVPRELFDPRESPAYITLVSPCRIAGWIR